MIVSAFAVNLARSVLSLPHVTRRDRLREVPHPRSHSQQLGVLRSKPSYASPQQCPLELSMGLGYSMSVSTTAVTSGNMKVPHVTKELSV